MEELKQALKEYNMGDEQTIKEIISEVDVDCVSFIYFNSFFFPTLFSNLSKIHQLVFDCR